MKYLIPLFNIIFKDISSSKGIIIPLLAIKIAKKELYYLYHRIFIS